MTPKEMKEIIRNEVRNAWKRLCLYIDVYGAADDLTVKARAKWNVLDDLWYKLYEEEY